MTQALLPMIRAGAGQINELISVVCEGKEWTYFCGVQPVFRHVADDQRAFRMFTAQLCVQGTCTQAEIIRTFGVSKNSLLRSTQKFREEDIEGSCSRGSRRDRCTQAALPSKSSMRARMGDEASSCSRGAAARRRFRGKSPSGVGAVGRRVFFLGNVHGWSPADRGRGKRGALAEYVIRYADGEEQVIPWIAGRTTDDWASAPEATEVVVGVQGDPWHLNVLGVELWPVEVREIIFRDLGTDSAPLLAAVTLDVASPPAGPDLRRRPISRSTSAANPLKSTAHRR